jgi:hypothetical protein
MMSLGQGAGVSFSCKCKHKINARSSTEAELIGVYDALPSILHMLYFIVAQGYDVQKNIIYQDNKSSITLEQNGKAYQGQSAQNTSRLGIFSSRTSSSVARQALSTAPRNRCGLMYLRSHFRAKRSTHAVQTYGVADGAVGSKSAEAKITGVHHDVDGVKGDVKHARKDTTNKACSSVSNGQPVASLRGVLAGSHF